jgi:hypothetical protein
MTAEIQKRRFTARGYQMNVKQEKSFHRGDAATQREAERSKTESGEALKGTPAFTGIRSARLLMCNFNPDSKSTLIVDEGQLG